MDDPIAFKATNDPDAAHCHETMRESDRGKFIKAMVKEVEDHVKHDHCELVRRDKVPAGTKVLDSVWSMKLKRDIMTRKSKNTKPVLMLTEANRSSVSNTFKHIHL